MEKLSPQEILSLCKTHNFWTWSAQSQVDPIPVERAEGVYFWDFDGKRYLDFNSMVMCVNIGHGNQHVIQAIQRQAAELAFAGPHTATYPRAMLAKLLAEVLPQGLTKFLFTLGGADANENAVKLARAYTGRPKIIARYRSYHGATHGALALTGDPRRLAWEPYLMPAVLHVPTPYTYRDALVPHAHTLTEEEYADRHLQFLQNVIQNEGPETIAAIMLEPVTGTNGILIPPQGYLQGVRALCDEKGILLIADEVMTGFGRTGRWFALEHWGVVPDIITLAKGLTSGYAPLGAVAMKPAIAAHFDERVYQGGLTYNGHPICLMAAIANIQEIQRLDLVAKSHEMSAFLLAELEKLQRKHPCVGDVRAIGLFAAIELVKDRQTREPLSPFGQTNAVMRELKHFTRQHGLFHYTHDNVILLIPPLIITPEQILEGLEIIDKALIFADEHLA